VPRMVGAEPAALGAVVVEDPTILDDGRVRLTYKQAALFRRLRPDVEIRARLIRTDPGYRGCMAKRWYAWMVSASEVLGTRGITEPMARAASEVMVSAKSIGTCRDCGRPVRARCEARGTGWSCARNAARTVNGEPRCVFCGTWGHDPHNVAMASVGELKLPERCSRCSDMVQ